MRITKIKNNSNKNINTNDILQAFIKDLHNEVDATTPFLNVYRVFFRYLNLNAADKANIQAAINCYTTEDESGNVYRTKQELRDMKKVLIETFTCFLNDEITDCPYSLHQHFDDMLEALNEFEKTHKLTSSEKVKFLKYLENRY